METIKNLAEADCKCFLTPHYEWRKEGVILYLQSVVGGGILDKKFQFSL